MNEDYANEAVPSSLANVPTVAEIRKQYPSLTQYLPQYEWGPQGDPRRPPALWLLEDWACQHDTTVALIEAISEDFSEPMFAVLWALRAHQQSLRDIIRFMSGEAHRQRQLCEAASDEEQSEEPTSAEPDTQSESSPPMQ